MSAVLSDVYFSSSSITKKARSIRHQISEEMTYSADEINCQWKEQAPISFDQWKNLLAKLTKDDHAKQLSSNSNPHHRSYSRQHSSVTKKSDRQTIPRNQVFGDGGMVDSIFISSSPNVTHTTLDGPRNVSSPTKRYVSSFKTLVTSTATKHSQKLSYCNDSVIILKLSKENGSETTNGRHSQLSNKHSPLSVTSSSTTSQKQSTPPPRSLSPMSKVEGQKRRIPTNEPSLIPLSTFELSAPLNSLHTMAMSATSHPSSNPSLFAYRSAATSSIRQRALAETTASGILITAERVKSTISSSMRPARQPLPATTTISSAYMSSQPPPPPRNLSQTTKSRSQKDVFDYPDPFTNCPPDVLSKLAQLTKLQMETVEWEKKRRFTKKKSFSNNGTQGKDSP